MWRLRVYFFCYICMFYKKGTSFLLNKRRHGVTGMMSDVGDIDDMVKNCIYLLEDTQRLAKFKGQAKRRAHDFSIDKILPLYEQLYQRVITQS